MRSAHSRPYETATKLTARKAARVTTLNKLSGFCMYYRFVFIFNGIIIPDAANIGQHMCNYTYVYGLISALGHV